MPTQTLNILFLSAVPEGLPSLDTDTEHRQIEDVLDESKNDKRFRVFRHARIQRQELERTLETFAPHIVHFAGHATKNGALLIESPDGKRWDLDRDTLRTIFRAYGKSVKLAVLNACHSELTANLVREVVPYVVGNAIAVFDTAALTFSTAFYTALFADETLHKSFRTACKAVEKIDPKRALVPQLLTTPTSPDPRDVQPLSSWLSPLATVTSVPAVALVVGETPTRADARRALDQHLLVADDFDAFVLEHFSSTYRRFSGGMNRVARTNLLIELHEPRALLNQLAVFLGDRQKK